MTWITLALFLWCFIGAWGVVSTPSPTTLPGILLMMFLGGPLIWATMVYVALFMRNWRRRG